MQGLKIIGLGSALPGKRVHNDDLAKIWGGNFLRVMTRVQAAAQS